MNQYQIREMAKIIVLHKMGMADIVALSLSALIRSAKRKSQQCAMIEYAELFGVRNHPKFII